MTAGQLAAWGMGVSEFPEHVRHAARRHLIDGFGTAIAAIRTKAAEPAIRVAQGLGGPAEADILGTDAKLSAPAAALANGTLVHALDFDDTHAGGLVHATAVVLPAAFAVGQQVGASGTQVLDAAIVGYETVCRVGAAAPHGFHTRGLHATMVAGVFASAMITSRLMNFSAAEAVNALGIAGSQAGGLLAFLATGAATKQLHPGFASQAGILAARLAAAGATGPATVFDGPHGVFDALTNGEFDPKVIIADLGKAWETERIGIKPYPVCQLSHATLDALIDARGNADFTIGEIASITAEVHPDSASVVCDDSRDLTRPATAYAAKFSMPWSAAALLVDGQLGLDTFDEDSLTRSEIATLAAKITWNISPGLGAAADAPGAVRIALRSGHDVFGSVRRSAGGPDQPLSRTALLGKFSANVGDEASDLVALLESIDDQPDVDLILTAVARAADQATREVEKP